MPILDKYGKPIRTKTLPPRRPLPAAPILKSSRSYMTDGLTPEKIGPIFREADRGNVARQAELFDQLIEHDGHILSEESKRINAITSQYLDWQLTPASDSQRDQDVARFVEKNVLDHDDWIKYKRSQQTAVGRGYACPAPEWDRSEGQAVVKNFDFIEHKRLVFQDPRTSYLRDWPLLATDQHPEGEEVHPRSIFLHKYGGLSASVTRSGVFRPITWMMVFKHFAIKDWWVFSELCGVPLRIGYYNGSSSPDDRKALEQALFRVGVDFAALIAEGTKIEFMDAAQNTSGAGLWEKQASFCNNEISKALVGSAAFSEAGKSGSYAMHTLETGVRADLTLADAQETAATDTDQWILPLVGFNFGWDTPLPKFRAVLKRQEDLEVKSNWLEPVIDRIGESISLSSYLENYGLQEVKKGERSVKDAMGTEQDTLESAKLIIAKAGQETPEQAAESNQDQIDKLTDKAIAKVDLAENEEIIFDLIMKSESYEEVYAGLADLYDTLGMEDLGKVMKDALLMAYASGVESVEKQVEKAVKNV